uniref:Small integral membrane protein 15 n=1 Tax=Catagonus wagneri TaxID=51154 RepID=A0A8C3YC75_9CETA
MIWQSKSQDIESWQSFFFFFFFCFFRAAPVAYRSSQAKASVVLSWKLAKMIEAREKEQKKKQKRQENIAKAKQLKKD